ncbi:uncharacterized protein LOC121265294 [Juglans microcarpa x Juglans regia]|uniref:uncharacterized protein LOC121265294 n=1 Tax=Juglans microcarpa x Juglans regia TaxID=2249226 RepID=UPI001B7DA9D5|nr:uncharacterized protein LOC121265294 [Juglans microcarpa x Juglans regia]
MRGTARELIFREGSSVRERNGGRSNTVPTTAKALEPSEAGGSCGPDTVHPLEDEKNRSPSSREVPHSVPPRSSFSSELDPVLACLRSLIRKCVHENFSGDHLLKLFPPDLPLDLQSILVLSFQKYQGLWKDDCSREQRTFPRTGVSYQVSTSVPPSFTSLLSSSEISTPPWPRQDDPGAGLHRGGNDFGAFTPIVSASGLQRDAVLPSDLESLPCLKSMNWTIENRNSAPTNRVAVVSLKLQDYSKSHSDEIEVKFQLSRDTLEAMLKSMTYISEQLSSMVGTPSEPAQKKQRQ